jgi:4-hydroxythreonine-4-phosphate dehydrogenase
MAVAPRLLITMGDVAGIGPEIIAGAWRDLFDYAQPVVVGDPGWLRRVLQGTRASARVIEVSRPDEQAPTTELIPCLRGTRIDLDGVVIGKVQASAGQAAFDFLIRAIELVQANRADGIVTCPLHKEGLHAAGLRYPGHTEILAERTGTKEFGMMLYARGPQVTHGLGVVHVTLHMALREVFRHITQEGVLEKVRLLHGVMRKLCNHPPRLAVAALNPHASDGGLFGDEERRILEPAVRRAAADGICVCGPLPSDTLFVRAQGGEFDGIVAMYHDQGHIPLKLLSGLAAVNITLGLPLVRTSVAHGTAYDIAGRGVADSRSLVEATRVAALLVQPPGSSNRG